MRLCNYSLKVRKEYIRLLKCEGRAKFNEKNSASSTRYVKVTTSSSRSPPTEHRDTSQRSNVTQQSSMVIYLKIFKGFIS